jgi:glycosyltransferase involved in cell wall biosynthesis
LIVRAKGLDNGIVFHGILERDAIADVFARSPIFVHPSLEESCPMVLLEAMAAGLPIVGGAAAGGVPWVLGDGDAGVLVDVRNPAAIAQGVASLLDDTARAAAFSERAQRRAEDYFSPTVVSSAYLDAYERVRRESP